MFAHLLGPGDSDSQAFTLHNDATDLGDRRPLAARFSQIGSNDYSFTTLPSSEDTQAFPVPDYLIRLDEDIPPGTDLVQVRVARPYDQFDPDGDVRGTVRPTGSSTSRTGPIATATASCGTTSMATARWTSTRPTPARTMSFTFHGAAGPTLQARVGDPLGRMTDGSDPALYHFSRAPGVSITDFAIEARTGSGRTGTGWAWAADR